MFGYFSGDEDGSHLENEQRYLSVFLGDIADGADRARAVGVLRRRRIHHGTAEQLFVALVREYFRTAGVRAGILDQLEDCRDLHAHRASYRHVGRIRAAQMIF